MRTEFKREMNRNYMEEYVITEEKVSLCSFRIMRILFRKITIFRMSLLTY